MPDENFPSPNRRYIPGRYAPSGVGLRKSKAKIKRGKELRQGAKQALKERFRSRSKEWRERGARLAWFLSSRCQISFNLSYGHGRGYVSFGAAESLAGPILIGPIVIGRRDSTIFLPFLSQRGWSLPFGTLHRVVCSRKFRIPQKARHLHRLRLPKSTQPQ